jgi:ornithine decarboxylase
MFVYCPKKLVQNVTVWKKYLPSVNLYYAMKCNPHPKIINELSKLDIGFECSAISEIKQCLPFNKDIIYGHPHKTKISIDDVKQYGIQKLVYDSIDQLKLMYSIYPKSQPILRIQSCEEKSEIKFNQKFGAHNEDLDELIYFHNKNNYNLHGISFHVGSKCYYPEQYCHSIDKIQTLINKYNLKINIIDIGGGFPLLNEEEFKNHANVIQTYINKHPSLQKYKFIGEPGRYVVDSVMNLKVKVINKKVVNGVNIYYINDGIYGSLNGVVFDGRIITDSKNSINKEKSILYGQTCDSFDKIECYLGEYNINDTIEFENLGAYSWASATSFNGFLPAKIFIKK